MKKNVLTFALAAAALGLPQGGYAWGSSQKETEKKTSERGTFSASINPSMNVRDTAFTFVTSDSNFAFASASTFALGFNPEVVWKDLARVRSQTSGGIGSTTDYTGRRLGTFNANLTATAFAPLFSNLNMGFIGGWEYVYKHVSERNGGAGQYITQGISYLNGAIAGLSLEGTPVNNLSLETAVLYHLPYVKGKARGSEGFVVSRMTGRRHGLTALLAANWKLDEKWAVRFGVKYTERSVSGGDQIYYNDFTTEYTTGFNYTF